MGGFGQSIKRRLLEKEPHLVLTLKEDPFLSKKNPLNSLSQELKEGIQNQTPFEMQELIIKADNRLLGVVAKGYTEQKIRKDISSYQIHFFDETSSSQESPKIFSHSIFISSSLATFLNVFEGDEVTVFPTLSLLLPSSEVPPLKTAQVHSILDKESKTETKLSISYLKGKILFKDFSQIQYGMEIKLKNPDTYPLYMDSLKNFKVQNWAQRNSSLFFALKLEKAVMFLLICLALLISFLGIASVLFLLITQKQKDIGILQAIGLSSNEVTKVFTYLGFLLSLVGIFCGLFLGISASFLLKHNKFPLLPAIYQDRTLPALITPFSYLIIALGVTVLAWFICYFPSRYLGQIPIARFLKSMGR